MALMTKVDLTDETLEQLLKETPEQGSVSSVVYNKLKIHSTPLLKSVGS